MTSSRRKAKSKGRALNDQPIANAALSGSVHVIDDNLQNALIPIVLATSTAARTPQRKGQSI